MIATIPHPAPSPLLLCDRLITLAQQADRAGYTVTAHHLALLAESMFEEQPAPARPAPARPAPAQTANG
jgi:hypothetical protein